MAKAKTATQLEADLARLSKAATENLYERIQIASNLLRDSSWLGKHDGSLDAAESYLADKYFPDLRGLIPLSKLVAMHDKIDKKTWSEYRFDIAAIESLYDESVVVTTETLPRKSWKAEAEDLARQVAELKAQLATERRLSQAREKELAELTTKASELEYRLAETNGRLMELEKMATADS